MNNPLVSVIIPIYNVEGYITRCLDSVIGQSYKSLEIIIVNDATPDGAMSIVADYSKKDNRIQIIENPCNQGLMMTRWNGFQTSTGQYVLFVDSDDYIPSDAVDTLLKKAFTSNADIVVGNICKYEKDDSSTLIESSLPYGTDTLGIYRALLNGKLTHSLCGKLFHRSLLEDHVYEILPEFTNGEDACLLYQIVKNIRNIHLVTSTVYHYMYNPLSLTHSAYTLKTVNNILAANVMQKNLCEEYSSLTKILDHNITHSVMRLYGCGVKFKDVSQAVANAGLSRYGTAYHALRVLSTHELLSLISQYIKVIVARSSNPK